MGQKLAKLKPVSGFAAETGGAITLFAATAMGNPVSTTHTITGAIMECWLNHEGIFCALGLGWQYRLGVDFHHPRIGLDCGCVVVDCVEIVLINS